ncbi:peptidyl-dipeptidase Dcp [Roseiarcus fermentans]|uniref:Peptidyl-dipeptidase Dcp n=1 Tax=Roseiarcus fermentans TaxID=1473586 RepID=A0A366FRS8_9HYPH|nr:M3 family metallopeptidase [Roseiarcus fermentans]RBP17318.1 peptidyl-dipeptidase Dcp [Roseiarcus fermentans]
MSDNPLLEPWTGPFEAPPFDRIAPGHFRPAFDVALSEARAEIDAVAVNPDAPTFANTIEALERSGAALDRVAKVFFTLAGADTSDEIEAIEREIAPKLARHRSDTYLNEALFRRVDALKAQAAGLGLTAEQARVLDRYHLDFVRAGAGAEPEAKARLAAIGERLATLSAAFGQNVLADEKAWTLWLDDGDLDGLPDFTVASAARLAAAHGEPGRYLVTLARSSVEPFLQFSARRDLREAAFRAWAARGENGGATDNRAIAAETIRLRAERARLLGYESHAHYRLADTMARTPQAALDLLESVWAPGVAAAEREAEALAAIAAGEGGNFQVAPWDWRYLSEKRRKAEFDFDESAVKPYLQLDRVIEAAFHAASRLFGLSFSERSDLALPHPDARAWTVSRDGAPIALFVGDYYARPSKHSGAWMSNIRGQDRLDGPRLPIVLNVMNFAKGGEGEAALLSFDDARTLFHEFGHALHGMLSDVTYPAVSGTRVPGDFVEFPSQLYEHWLEQPELLRRFAVHYQTGEPMPEALIDKLVRARRFNQGFATVEYTASALVDLALHLEPRPDDLDVVAFERAELQRIGMPDGIAMRHRTPHFQHVFSGGYSAAYYSYLWSEVLDADGFEAFAEAGDLFDPEVARRLHDFVYSAGGSRDFEEAYRAFRGRPPSPDALFRKRGLAQASA